MPPGATARTRALAEVWAARWGTPLVVFDAVEFADARYRANPADRCFFCKTRLYGTIAGRLHGTGTLVLSGTNTDDLADYRPGPTAAAAHGVRHPFVEAGISKTTLRRIAPLVGLGALADLPSAPCLSSRIETGLRIEPRTLALVHAVETLVAAGAVAAQGALLDPSRWAGCRARRGKPRGVGPRPRGEAPRRDRATGRDLGCAGAPDPISRLPHRQRLLAACRGGGGADMSESLLDAGRTARIGFGEAIYCAG